MSERREDSVVSSKEARELVERVGHERASVCVFIVETFGLKPSDLPAIERGLAY